MSTASATTLRNQFPILRANPDLVYLDNGATTQKPQTVIDRISTYYNAENSNVHRGVHRLADAATEAYDGARERVRSFLQAESTEEIVFTRGTTEAINLVASSFGAIGLKPGSRILLSEMEHHANIVPWQLAAERYGCELDYLAVADDGSLDLSDLEEKLTPETALVAIVHLSNVLGTVNPVERIIEYAHARNIPVLIDAAQSAARMVIDIPRLDPDFLVFSGHKLYGPTGIGVLYGRRALLDRMPPYQGGGAMIDNVDLQRSTWNDLPYKFEAGTPNIAGAAGLAAAIDWLEDQTIEAVARHESALVESLRAALEGHPAVTLLPAPAGARTGAVSFSLKGVHHLDAAQILDKKGFALRSGHHCAQPLHRRFGITGSLRASFAAYNSADEVDRFLKALDETIGFLK